MADRFCCIAGGMYRYDEEPDGRQLYVTLEEHQKLVETVEFLDSAIRAEHPNWAAIFERLDSVCDHLLVVAILLASQDTTPSGSNMPDDRALTECKDERAFRFRWRHGPAPGLTFYSGRETAYGPNEETAKRRALRAVCQRGLFSPGCITMELSDDE